MSRDHAVLDFAPQYCPRCGRELGSHDGDYFRKCTHTCPGCGFGYQYAGTQHIIEAAIQAGGDADRWWT